MEKKTDLDVGDRGRGRYGKSAPIGCKVKEGMR